MRSFSGLFVSIDGPSGVGKPTARGLAQLLRSDSRRVYVTSEPSDGPIGELACELTETCAGTPWPACMPRTATTT